MALDIEAISDSGPKYPYLYIGLVHSVNDPRKMGRVDVVVPAVCGDTPLGFALPMSVIGGGTKDGLGLFSIPPVGATVGVMFENGDVASPYYFPGWFPAPGGTSAAPVVGGVGPGDPEMVVWQTPKFTISMDAAASVLRIESREAAHSGNLFLQIDGVSGEMTLSTDGLKALLLGDLAASELAVLGNVFMAFFNAHTHPETGVTTGTPTVPMSVTQLSSKVKIAT